MRDPKKPRDEVVQAVRFLEDAYWESLDDLQYAKVTLVEALGWPWEDWCDAVTEETR